MLQSLVISVIMILLANANALAQDIAFGSETWRGHAFRIEGGPLACRVFSYFGDGDRLSLTASVPSGSSSVTFMAFVAPDSIDSGTQLSPSSIARALERTAGAGQKAPPIRAWVDDDQATAMQGVVAGRVVSFPVGTLDAPKAAKFFHAIRDGQILHLTVGGEERRYVLKGTFTALSELVGCALKARDGEVALSNGLLQRPTEVPSVPPAIPQPAQAVASAMPVQKQATPSKKLISTGSGIVVNTDGNVLTNYHVVKGCTSLGVRSVGDEEQSAALLAQDQQNDFALIHTARPYKVSAVFRIEPPRLAESVLVYGFPMTGLLASSGNVTLGNICALTGLFDDSRDIQITAAVQPGNSGGPVFDGSGLLLGVVESKLDVIRAASVTGDIAQNVNFAIRTSLAASFLSANGVEVAFERRHEALQPDEVSERAQKVTVQLLCYGASQ